MTASELVIFTGLYIFAIVVLPLIFIVLFDKEEVVKPFDKSTLEYKDGDNT
tara:strand:+ start:331 stop:483 length:153 start_codon:yes stop_codon:yes gene_type:complete